MIEDELESIKNECLSCQKCSLWKSRTNIVFSDGAINSKLMLIGEAPGFNEDQTGKTDFQPTNSRLKIPYERL